MDTINFYIIPYFVLGRRDTRVHPVCGDASARRPRQPIRRRQYPPFLDFYTYFRHYCAFCVAINSFSVTLKFLKGILNIHSSSGILICLQRTKSPLKFSRRKDLKASACSTLNCSVSSFRSIQSKHRLIDETDIANILRNRTSTRGKHTAINKEKFVKIFHVDPNSNAPCYLFHYHGIATAHLPTII